MAQALLDILDSELRLWRDGRATRSPGYALLDGDNYRYGEEARGFARKQPRSVNTRFWWQLGTRPLQPALGTARHSADLVHGHLLDLHKAAGEPAELVLAVPDSLQRDQLSLLLGIVRACPFEAVGLVNRSLLYAANHDSQGTIYHLELQLHQALLTRLDADAGELRLTQSQAIPGCGLLALHENIVEAIARAFIQNTRFDPRRKADTEQTLYDGLSETLATLGEADDTTLELGGYRTRIAYDDLRDAGEKLYNAVSAEVSRDGGNPLLLLDPLVEQLPGFSQRFARTHIASARDLPEALAAHAAKIVQPGEALHLVKSLPIAITDTQEQSSSRSATSAPEAAHHVAQAPDSSPTHLLHNGRAKPLAGRSMPLGGHCELTRTDSGWTLRGDGDFTVNNRPWTDGVLHSGDRILVSGSEWQLIEVAG